MVYPALKGARVRGQILRICSEVVHFFQDMPNAFPHLAALPPCHTPALLQPRYLPQGHWVRQWKENMI